MRKKFKAGPGMQMTGIKVEIAVPVGDAEGKVSAPKKQDGFSTTFDPAMYQKRSTDVTGFEATYPAPTSDKLAMLIGLRFDDIFVEPES